VLHALGIVGEALGAIEARRSGGRASEKGEVKCSLMKKEGDYLASRSFEFIKIEESGLSGKVS
jgi:hypothetical protein